VPPASQAKGFINSMKVTRDCAFFTFKADSPLVSKPAVLKSYVFRKVCKGERCYEELARTEKRKVTVSLSGTREILPWEKDVFSVCLKDTAVSAKVIEASSKYKITKTPGAEIYEINAAASAKLRTAPDNAGITAQSWSVSGETGSLKLVLKDKWSEIYGLSQTEKTVIKLTVRQDKTAWFDGVVFEKEITLAPAEHYRIDLSEYASELKQPLQDGRKYYAQWSFSRKGGISKNSFVNGGETARVVFPVR